MLQWESKGCNANPMPNTEVFADYIVFTISFETIPIVFKN